ncbi:MAG: 4-hydroxy-tetrahydrodipicolinate synthase [Hyphomicrobiaceae bacterium]|nr:4-hydroxy-tetrahydrodipicolinate synthase [Hyphomicrobiaceae bacterium]
MSILQSTLQGLWLPLVTPFRDGALDETSLRRLVRHYAGEPVDGFVLAATTGEGLTLDVGEVETLVGICTGELKALAREMPVLLGASGSHTAKLVKSLERTSAWPIDGYLIACPYYTRPSQDGLFAHFTALAEAATHPILIYNIPYRTGVNMENDTMVRLAAHDRIVGAKDCCADPAQTFDLLRERPEDFAVLTGEDAQYFAALTCGANGAILASAHIETRRFAHIRNLIIEEDLPGALTAWRAIADLPRLLFAEPSPSAIKHWLWRTDLIDSPEVRLPMMPVSESLARRVDQEIGDTKAQAVA